MSLRFTVNNVQIFGNNEMFDNTYHELERQGADMEDDLVSVRIYDPQALMDAVEKDTFEYLIKDKDIDSLRDKDLIIPEGGQLFKNAAYYDSGKVRPNAYRNIEETLKWSRFFTSYNLYQAIKNDVELKDGKLVLKKGHAILAEWF